MSQYRSSCLMRLSTLVLHMLNRSSILHTLNPILRPILSIDATEVAGQKTSTETGNLAHDNCRGSDQRIARNFIPNILRKFHFCNRLHNPLSLYNALRSGVLTYICLSEGIID